MKIEFEWDENKNARNASKHGVSFNTAQQAFLDPKRIMAIDDEHSTGDEKRYFCFGRIENEIVTVRFTYRENRIRIFGAGFWRKGKKEYEKRNKIH